MGIKEKNSTSRPVLGLYWRKMAFLGFTLCLCLIVFSGIKFFKADVDFYDPALTQDKLNVKVEITPDGSVLVDGQKIKEKIKRIDGKDELILPILDNVGQSYSEVNVELKLPKSVAGSSTFNSTGSHGVGSSDALMKNGTTIVYIAKDVDATALFSITVDMPEGTVKFPLSYQIYSIIENLKSSFWLFLALILPLSTLAFMILFIAYQARRQKVEVPPEETNSPPMALPPALVGVLYKQKVGAREIAATLIDLALRGDIYILDRERDFAFAKNRLDKRLLSYEKILLSKIFRKNLVSDKAEIEERINNHLYSKKISLVSSGIYVLATRLGYFQVNPQKLHLKYQLLGILSFFVGLGGFILSLLIFSNPPYVAFFWVGMMVSGIIITLTAKNIPSRTILGQEAMSNWLAFRKYLSNPEKLPFSYESQDLFQKYLAYAIVFDCEVAWAKRFSEQNFVIPDWYVSSQSGLGLQDFCLSLFPLVSYVARSLAAVREPGFE